MHCVGTACSAHAMKPIQGGREETTLHLCRRHKVLRIPDGWLLAMAKHNLLLPECVGRWWQPSRDIDILP